MESKKSSAPVDERSVGVTDQTIQQYLDSLLQEVTDDAESEVKTAPEPEPAKPEPAPQAAVPARERTPEPPPPSAKKAKTKPEPAPASPPTAPIVTPPAAPEPVPTPKPQPEPERAKQAPEQPDWTGHPAWAEHAFDCLLFDVAGLKLAVPLVQLGTIIKMETRMSELFGQADWMMGLLPVQGQQIRVVDTARWVMPEKYTADMKDHYEYVLTINDTEWGIAAHSIAQSVTMKADQVKWRSQRTSRPWLAGTVIDHMCALMDMDAMSALLHKSDKNIKK